MHCACWAACHSSSIMPMCSMLGHMHLSCTARVAKSALSHSERHLRCGCTRWTLTLPWQGVPSGCRGSRPSCCCGLMASSACATLAGEASLSTPSRYCLAALGLLSACGIPPGTTPCKCCCLDALELTSNSRHDAGPPMRGLGLRQVQAAAAACLLLRH